MIHAKVATLIVRKFPQIDQAVIAPALVREICIALAEAEDGAARLAVYRCVEIAREISNSYSSSEEFPSLHAVGAETVACAIRHRFPLFCLEGYTPKPESETKVSPENDTAKA